ncbi:MAG: biopolymer transporter ExbD [Hyphomonadaceae bacterium]
MASFSLRRARDRSLAPSAEPNVIPFIDVLLVLLIIFMVTAPKPTVDLQLEMPGPRPVYVPPAIPPTIVELRQIAGGYRLIVDERDVSIEALPQIVLSSALATDPALTPEDVYADARVFVRADQGIAYGNVVAVIDELQHAGFAKVGVFAQTAEDA